MTRSRPAQSTLSNRKNPIHPVLSASRGNPLPCANVYHASVAPTDLYWTPDSYSIEK